MYTSVVGAHLYIDNMTFTLVPLDALYSHV